MNSEVSVVLHPCVGLMPTAITRRVKRWDAQAPEACAVVIHLVTSISVLGLVFARERKDGERKVQIRG